MSKMINLEPDMDKKVVKATNIDKLVNYTSHSSSGSMYSDPYQSTSNPRSLSFLIKNNQIVYYRLETLVDKEATVNKETK